MGKKNKASSKKRSRKSEAEEEQEVYHVEVVTKARVVAEEDGGAKWQYYVKWAGYESDANTWEPEENLVSRCQRLLTSFWNHVGTDDRDYDVGYVANASQEWIDEEKAFFATEYRNALDERRKAEKGHRREAKSKSKKSIKRSSSQDISQIPGNEASGLKSKDPSPGNFGNNAASLEDDKPLHESFKIKIPPHKKRKLVVASDESSDDEPLAKSSGQPVAPKAHMSTSKAKVAPSASSSRGGSPTSLFSVPSSPEMPLSEKPPPPPSKAQPAVHVNREAKLPLPSIKIPRRPSNPHAKIADMAPSEVPTGSGISTKQRLAQGALAPTLPKEIPATQSKPAPSQLKPAPNQPKPAPKPLPTRTHNPSFMNLSFKKNPPPLSIPNNTNTQSTPTPTSAFRSPIYEPAMNSPSIRSPQPPSSVVGNTMISNPASNVTSQTSIFKRPLVHDNTVTPALISQPLPMMTEADKFLQEIMPSSLAAPLLPTAEQVAGPAPPKAIHSRALPGRIPKVWKWSGPLYLPSTKSAICDVKIHDVTHDQSLRFSIVFQNVDKILASCLYDNADLSAILPAFRSPPQLGLLSPEEEKDIEPFKTVVRYMTKSQKTFMLPIILDDKVIGQTMFFHASFKNFMARLRIPLNFSQQGDLIAAILPWTLSQVQLEQDTRKPHNPSASLKPTFDRNLSLCKNPKYHHGLRMLGFPEELYKFLTDRKDPIYCIWWDTKSGSKKAGMETEYLREILKQAGARDVGFYVVSRMVFVHVGALKTIDFLPGLVDRRARSQHVHFYTYGTHEDVSPNAWVVKEIYPCGGIVTFTPSVMDLDECSVRQKIAEIEKHPLWACYILPSALGLLAKRECRNEDPLIALEEGTLRMKYILEAIENGSMALIQAPPEHLTPTQEPNINSREAWLRQYLVLRPPTQRQALQMGIKAFLANPKLSSADSQNEMVHEITRDISSMQRQPVIMDRYRRYIVVISEDEGTRVTNDYCGLEWSSIKNFDFKDDFYPKQTVGK